MLFRGIRHIHFVGIGGIGMSGIAEVLLSLEENFRVTGSDLKRSTITDRLESMGATVYEGHRAENTAGANVVVCSSAVREDNPEVAAARRFAPVEDVAKAPLGQSTGGPRHLLRKYRAACRYSDGVADCVGKPGRDLTDALPIEPRG